MPDRSQKNNLPSHPWRVPLLIAEFFALAILLGSMFIFSGLARDGATFDTGWLLIPAVASLVVFVSFIGLMYLRWVAASEAGSGTRQKVVFALLTLTLLGIWAFSIVQTWSSITANS
ncbi:hypothetical protein [Marinobacter changyiensis]|uniref:hypothetical protein n=1 Tax=Marinobacter changyiensis TaxID=2604091 RepID=UPI0012649F3F|nr:hypothetical protein [Marinobacter changyiensis]